MPIQNNIQVSIACPGEVKVVEDTNHRDTAPSSATGDSATITTTEIPGPTLTRRDSSLDLTEVTTTSALLTTVTSASGTVEDVYFSDEAGNRLAYVQQFFKVPEYDPNQDSITGIINAGPNTYPFATPSTPLATPLVKFIPSTSGKGYCVIIQVLPGYVFENADHDFLRFTLYIDGEERVVRTVSAQQMAALGGGRPWSVVIHGMGGGQDFVWKDIKVKEGEDVEPQDHDEWNYSLGTIHVYVERMREEGRAVFGEDAGSGEGVEDEEDEDEGEDGGEDAGEWESEEDENDEDEDEEMEDVESEDEDDENEEEVTLPDVNVEGRCLTHYTAYVCLSATKDNMLTSTSKDHRAY